MASTPQASSRPVGEWRELPPLTARAPDFAQALASRLLDFEPIDSGGVGEFTGLRPGGLGLRLASIPRHHGLLRASGPVHVVGEMGQSGPVNSSQRGRNTGSDQNTAVQRYASFPERNRMASRDGGRDRRAREVRVDRSGPGDRDNNIASSRRASLLGQSARQTVRPGGSKHAELFGERDVGPMSQVPERSELTPAQRAVMPARENPTRRVKGERAESAAGVRSQSHLSNDRGQTGGNVRQGRGKESTRARSSASNQSLSESSSREEPAASRIPPASQVNEEVSTSPKAVSGSEEAREHSGRLRTAQEPISAQERPVTAQPTIENQGENAVQRSTAAGEDHSRSESVIINPDSESSDAGDRLTTSGNSRPQTSRVLSTAMPPGELGASLRDAFATIDSAAPKRFDHDLPLVVGNAMPASRVKDGPDRLGTERPTVVRPTVPRAAPVQRAIAETRPGEVSVERRMPRSSEATAEEPRKSQVAIDQPMAVQRPQRAGTGSSQARQDRRSSQQQEPHQTGLSPVHHSSSGSADAGNTAAQRDVAGPRDERTLSRRDIRSAAKGTPHSNLPASDASMAPTDDRNRPPRDNEQVSSLRLADQVFGPGHSLPGSVADVARFSEEIANRSFPSQIGAEALASTRSPAQNTRHASTQPIQRSVDRPVTESASTNSGYSVPFIPSEASQPVMSRRGRYQDLQEATADFYRQRTEAAPSATTSPWTDRRKPGATAPTAQPVQRSRPAGPDRFTPSPSGIDTSALPVGGVAASAHVARQHATRAIHEAISEAELSASASSGGGNRNAVKTNTPAPRSARASVNGRSNGVTHRNGVHGGLANGHTAGGGAIQLAMRPSAAAQNGASHSDQTPAAQLFASGIGPQLNSAMSPIVGTETDSANEREPQLPVLTEDQITVLIQRLEQRVLSEIERRGGRHMGGF